METSQNVESPIFSPLFEKEITVRLQNKEETFTFRFDQSKVAADVKERAQSAYSDINPSFYQALDHVDIRFRPQDMFPPDAGLDQKISAKVIHNFVASIESRIKPTEDNPGGLTRAGLAGGEANPDGTIKSLDLAIDINQLAKLAQSYLGPDATSEQFIVVMDNLLRIVYDHEAEHVAQWANPTFIENDPITNFKEQITMPLNIARAGLPIMVAGALVPDSGLKTLVIGLGLGISIAGYFADNQGGDTITSSFDNKNEHEAVANQRKRNPAAFSKICTIIHRNNYANC